MKNRFLSLYFLTVFPLWLYGQTGSLDTSFSQDGVDILSTGPGIFDISYASALQSDGKIVLAGWTTLNGNSDYFALRYLPDGSYDTGFGTEGVVIADYNNTPDRCQALTIQPDGKLLLGGSTDSQFASDFSVMRMLPDGEIDTTFGDNGWVITDLGTSFEFINAIAVQSDGKIVVTGRIEEGFFSDMAMVRYHSNGTIDSLFGENGIVVTDVLEEDVPNDIIIDPEGKVILGGFASISAVGNFALARYNPDGTPDKFFGQAGVVLTDLERLNLSDYINEILLLQDGKILAAGNASGSNTSFTSAAGVVRYHSNGDIDTTFGSKGVAIFHLGTKTDVEGLAVQPDGKILICGQTNVDAGQQQWLLMRLEANGQIDTTFGHVGYVTTAMGGGSAFPNGVFVQPDTRIVVSGTAGMSPNFRFAAARYIADFTINTVVTGISCYGASDGAIEVNVTGGVEPYTFCLNGLPPQASNQYFNLPADTYYIMIKDAGGLGMITSTLGPLVIEDLPVPPSVFVEAGMDGNWIIIHLDGHDENLSYLYSIDGGTTYSADSVFTDLADGTYEVVVADVTGCIIHNEQVILTALGTSESAQNQIQVYPNPARNTVYIKWSGDLYNVNQLALVDLTGKTVRREVGLQPTRQNISLPVDGLAGGVYILKAQIGVNWILTKVLVAD